MPTMASIWPLARLMELQKYGLHEIGNCCQLFEGMMEK